MNKRYFIIMVLFFGFGLTWGVLQVSATKAQLQTPEITPTPPIYEYPVFSRTNSLSPKMPAIEENPDQFIQKHQGCQNPINNSKDTIYAWKEVYSPGELPLTQLSFLSENNGWVVGDYGTILHWNGSTWQTVSSPVGYNLSDIFMLSANDGWIVGGWDPANQVDLSIIMHWNGVSWQVVNSPTGLPLRAVYMISPTDGWIVGGSSQGNVVLRWDGIQWSIVPSETPEYAFLLDVDMLSSTDGWAVGNYGTFLHWDGNQWNLVPSPTNQYVNGIDMLSSAYGWAVGGTYPNGEIYKWDGYTWEKSLTPMINEMFDLFIQSETDIWASSYWGHQILHWDGSSWSIIQDGWYTRGIKMLSAINGWAVGNGFILQYTEFDGLSVYVENADGQPAVHALVEAWDIENRYGAFAWSNTQGMVYLWLELGNYIVNANSWTDHFYYFQNDVPSTGEITLSAYGTSEVTLTAKKKDGTPLDDADVVIGNFLGIVALHYPLGTVDSNGVLIFHISPETYDIGVIDSTNLYLLVSRSEEFSPPSDSLDFDMSTRPSAEIIVGHPFDSLSLMYINPWTTFSWPYQFPNLHDGSHIVVSPNQRYDISQLIERIDNIGNYWGYQFDPKQLELLELLPGEVFTFTSGGTLNYSARADDAFVGSWITLTETIDTFDSVLMSIYTRAADHPYGYGTFVDQQIELTNPEGHTSQLDWWWYDLPITATIGTYDIHAEWDTGPYQGLLTADSQFEVMPQQTSAVISPDGGTLYSTWDNTLYEFAPGTFTDTVIITHTVRYVDIPSNDPLLGIGHFFDVTAVYSSTGLPAQPTQPYTITIGYNDWDRGPVIENGMGLYEWDDTEWVREPTSLVIPEYNQLFATPNHFSTWGVWGETNRIFIPLITRQ